MTHRFFKLLYIFALISLALSLPIYLLTNIQFDAIIRTTYKAKCLSNDQYVVLQGSPSGEAWEFDEFILNSPLSPELDAKKELNFYCKYYDAIQPHIAMYNEAKTPSEQTKANLQFVEFEKSVPEVDSYPPLYKLEVVSEVTQLNQIWSPLIGWFIYAVFAFLVLQILRISYVYIVFGKMTWHPFKAGRID